MEIAHGTERWKVSAGSSCPPSCQQGIFLRYLPENVNESSYKMIPVIRLMRLSWGRLFPESVEFCSWAAFLVSELVLSLL